MSDSTHRIVQYWHSREVPEDIGRAMATFGSRNPELAHRVFHEDSAADLIAEHFTDREVAAFRSCAVPAMQADYFRYCAVHALGGVYSDAGWECVADLRPMIPRAGHGNLFRASGGNIINGIFAFGSPRHELLELTVEIATASIEQRLFERVYFNTGVPIFICLLGLPQFNSFDAAIARFAGTKLEKFIRACCEVIGDYARVEHVSDGIEVSAAGGHLPFVRPVELEKFRRENRHWSQAERIFRQ